MKILVSWLILMVLAIVNGGIRDFLYLRKTGKEAAHQISTIVLIIVILIYTFVFQQLNFVESVKESISIGMGWFLLTLTFEFLAGHYLFKNSWENLLENYKIHKGKLWILIPLEVLIVNYIVFLLKS